MGHGPAISAVLPVCPARRQRISIAPFISSGSQSMQYDIVSYCALRVFNDVHAFYILYSISRASCSILNALRSTPCRICVCACACARVCARARAHGVSPDCQCHILFVLLVLPGFVSGVVSVASSSRFRWSSSYAMCSRQLHSLQDPLLQHNTQYHVCIICDLLFCFLAQTGCYYLSR